MFGNSFALHQGQRLKVLRQICKLSVAEFAQITTISQSTIRNWEAKKIAQISTEKAKVIVNTVKNCNIITTTDWLLYGVGALPLKAARDQKMNQTNLAAMQKEQALFLANTPSAVTLKVTDDAMLPLYESGTIIGGKYLSKKDISFAIGKDCIIKLATTMLCRKLFLGKKPHTFTLACLNPNPISTISNINDVKIIKVAPIIRIWKHLS